MFSPHDSPTVNEWFQRFDAASRHLPAEERAAQREEIQQHLEGLAAAKMAQGQPTEAAWKAALMQFGDPVQIGRKMYQEWRLGTTGFRADMKAILFGLGMQTLGWFAAELLFFLWISRFYNPNDRLYTHGRGISDSTLVVNIVTAYGGAILINVAIGWKYPLQAIKAAFYSNVLWNLWSWGVVVAIASSQHSNHLLPHPLAAAFAHSMLLMPAWVLGHSAIAYLASVTKRGWYKPSLADFKLTLPRRRPQLSR